MALMSSADEPLRNPVELTVAGALPLDLQRLLFQVAEESIATTVASGRPLEVDPAHYPAILREPRATFVTLRIAGKLRGCMGSLVVREPLVCDVSLNASAAAARDPRFPPVTAEEVSNLEVHLSILTAAEPLVAGCETELVGMVRTGVDGLILLEGSRRATLLPSVWESVSQPREFLAHLKRKAGLPADYWSETIRFERYTALSLHKPID